MNINKTDILNKICYTALVYGRINKKLKSNYSKTTIEKLLYDIIQKSDEHFFQRIGKNIYIYNEYRKEHYFIRLDTHSGNERINQHYSHCGFTFKGIKAIEWTNDLPEHYKDGPFSLFEITL